MCRGQCYDGASVMTGIRNGVSTNITKEESRAVFTHCYGHSLNLAINDIVKNCRLMKSTMDVVTEISKLIKKSPKRDAMFQKLKQSLSPDTTGFRVLCPTRWTVRASSLQSVIDNYEVLLGVWEESLQSALDSEMRSRIIGVEFQMQKFEFLFGVLLGALLLSHSDNLSKSLQHKSMSAAEGQQVARLTLEVLKKLRTSDNFQLFFAKVTSYQKKFLLEDPSLPRKRHAPARIEVGSSSGYFPSTVEDHYRAIYYEALDLIVEGITNRFDQRGYGIFKNLEEVILKVCKNQPFEEELEFICNFYKDDIDKAQLQCQLPMLYGLIKHTMESPDCNREMSILFVVKALSGLSCAQRVAFSQVFVIVRLLLVLPATNATSERSFSALRRVKTYLRSTMTQMRLNNLLILHTYKDETDSLDLPAVGNEFVSAKAHFFGTF